jgi:hypothetical protein
VHELGRRRNPHWRAGDRVARSVQARFRSSPNTRCCGNTSMVARATVRVRQRVRPMRSMLTLSTAGVATLLAASAFEAPRQQDTVASSGYHPRRLFGVRNGSIQPGHDDRRARAHDCVRSSSRSPARRRRSGNRAAGQAANQAVLARIPVRRASVVIERSGSWTNQGLSGGAELVLGSSYTVCDVWTKAPTPAPRAVPNTIPPSMLTPAAALSR